jgi:hypothetical protein
MCSQVSKKNTTRSGSVIDDIAGRLRPAEDTFGRHSGIVKSLSLMLKMMRIWGLYFGCYDTFRFCNQSHIKQQEETEAYANSEGKPSRKHRSIYATIVLLMLWMNVIRFLLAFKPGHEFNSSTISQISFLQTFLQCAVLQTSYFFASRNGKLDQVLDRLNVADNFAEQVRKYATACIVCNSLIYLAALVLGIYALFLFDDKLDFVLAPFTTYISVDEIWLNVLKFMVVIVFTFVVQSWLWSLLMNLLLTVILYLLFRQVNDRFRAALNHRGQFTGDLKMFRNRHQTLSEVVLAADCFMRLGNVASIVCPMISVIVLLFEITIIGFSDPATGFNFSVLLLMSVLDLTVCVSSGVMVNNVVSHKKLILASISKSILCLRRCRKRRTLFSMLAAFFKFELRDYTVTGVRHELCDVYTDVRVNISCTFSNQQ